MARRVYRVGEGDYCELSFDGAQVVQANRAGTIEVWTWPGRAPPRLRTFALDEADKMAGGEVSGFAWDGAGKAVAYAVERPGIRQRTVENEPQVRLYSLDVESGRSEKWGEWQNTVGGPLGWSPSGTWLAAEIGKVRRGKQPPGLDELRLELVHAGDYQTIRSPHGWNVFTSPVWSLSEDHLCVMMAPSRNPYVGSVPQSSLWELNLQTRSWRRVASFGLESLDPVCYATDGVSIWCLQRLRTQDAPVIGLMDRDTAIFRPIVNIADHMDPWVSLVDYGLSPDRRWLVLVLANKAVAAIGLFNLDTRRLRLIPHTRIIGLGMDTMDSLEPIRVDDGD